VNDFFSICFQLITKTTGGCPFNQCS